MSKRNRKTAAIFDPANNDDLANYWEHRNDEEFDGNHLNEFEVNEMLHNLNLDARNEAEDPLIPPENINQNEEDKVVEGTKWRLYNPFSNNEIGPKPPESIRNKFVRTEAAGAANIPWEKTDETKKEIDYFKLFFTDEDMDTIAKNTYSKILNKIKNPQLKRKWLAKPLTRKGIQDYFCIVLWMGLVRVPERSMYWEETSEYFQPFVKHLFIRDEFNLTTTNTKTKSLEVLLDRQFQDHQQ